MEKFDVKATIEEYFDDYKKDLAALVAVDSKCDDGNAQPGAPLGPGPRKALDTAMAMAERLGYKTTTDTDGYYGFADIGEGDELFGVLGHLDVVPADDKENWDTDPFTLIEKDGKFHGRGCIDDKGPMTASMYALKILLDKGAVLKKRVRFICCTDEESLWRCVKKYISDKQEIPASGITPDADFPLLYAEKGLVEYDITSEDADFIEFVGGSAYNAVAAEAKIPMDDAVKKAMDELGYEYKEEDGKLVAIGRAAHAMVPETGVNAIVHLAEACVKAGNTSNMLKFIAEKGNDPLGHPIFGEVSDEMSGPLKFNIGLADFKPGSQKLGIDIRFPVTYEKEKVDKTLDDACTASGVKLTQFDYLRSLYIPTDTDYIKTLMQAYQEVTGDKETKPISTGGATFARSMDNIVAFGALLPGEPQTEHQVNECVTVQNLKTAMEVYIRMFELWTM